jgi:hypothetical protein
MGEYCLRNLRGAMRLLYAFLVMTADGFDEGPKGEFDWPMVEVT